MDQRNINADIDASDLKIAVVVSRFNGVVTDRLLKGAKDAFLRHGGHETGFTLARVPGAFEIPLVLRELAKTGRYDALVALAAVIRGSTPHFDYVAAEVSKGVAHVQLELGVPIGFGVLTCDTLEQAVDRAGAKSGNKGYDATLAAIETARVLSAIRALKD
ncbi:MAG: 6,7-dimethyl-8-ribityllumazine synthase [Deltaproteobacteria bacterium]|nr:6,7-dimethyl-8-ribityllumazine synthase [Deltaproteobacteria bacterium]